MKKTNISKFVAVGLCICALTGCGASPDEKPDTSNPIVNSNTNEENANGSSENKGNDILDRKCFGIYRQWLLGKSSKRY